MSRTRRQRIIVTLTLGLALLLGCSIRIEQGRTFDGDEAASLLAIACQERRASAVLEQGAAPVAQWVPVQRWRRFIEPRKLCFGEIATGLFETDRHPPVYFWLLHVWSLIFASTMPAMLGLNLVFGLFTGWLLYLLSRRLIGEPALAAFTVLAWAVNPRTIDGTQLARPYQLFALATVLFALICVDAAHRPARPGLRDELALCAAAWFGLLVHYHFLLVASAGGAYLLWALGPRRAFPAGVAVVLGLAATNLVHPTFRAMLKDGIGAELEADRVVSSTRVLGEVSAFFTQLVPGRHASNAVLTFIGLAVPSLLALAAGLRHQRRGTADARFLVVPTLVVIEMMLLQRFGFGPSHFGGARYLTPVQPLLALVPSYLLAALTAPARRELGAAVIGLLACVASLRSLSPDRELQRSRSRQIELACAFVVIPTAHRLPIFSFVAAVGGKLKILAGPPARLDAALEQVRGKELCLLQTRGGDEVRKRLDALGRRISAEIDRDYRLKRSPSVRF